MKVSEWLRERFGKSAEAILGIENEWIGGAEMFQASFCASAGTGLLQVSCGGDCLIQFSYGERNVRGCIFLIRDDSEGEAWEAEQYQQPETYCAACDRKHRVYPPTRPRPFAVLRLVASA
jgi:hypothetical protein